MSLLNRIRKALIVLLQFDEEDNKKVKEDQPAQQTIANKEQDFIVPDFNELNQRNEKIKEIYNQNYNNEIRTVCPNCGYEPAYLVTCTVCGKSGCEECFTFDAETKKYYCKDCW